MNEYNESNLDAELRPLADGLDRLAALERAAASPAMEDRIVMATRAATAPAAPRIHEPVAAGRISVSRQRVWVTRLAAAMAVSLCAWGVYTVARPSARPARSSDVDSLLAAMDAVDSVTGSAAELQTLAAQVTLIQSTIRGDYPEVESDQENM